MAKTKPLVIMARYIAIIMAIVLVWNILFMNTVIPSNSMESTIMTGDRVLCYRLFTSVDRGDIVVFLNPDTERGGYLVKRVVAIGGDKVSFEDGYLVVNGEKQDEPYTTGETKEGYILGEIIVPEDEYFLLGDNREDSTDCRYFSYPFIRRSEIIAKAGIRYFPFDRFGILN